MVRPLKAAMRVLDEARLVERVGVDRHLHVVAVGDAEAVVDRRRRRAPILVQLQAAGAGLDLLDQALGQAGIALAEEAEIHREGLGRLQHARQVPGPGRAGGGRGAGGRSGAAADHGGDAGIERLLDLLRADEVDVHIDAAGGDDAALAGDHLGAGADDDVDPGLDVGIAGLADGGDAPVLDADVGLDDAPMVEDQRVGDDGVDGALGAAPLALAHAVADHLAAAELHLLAVDRAVLLDLDEELGIGQPDAVAGGGAEHAGISRAAQTGAHGLPPSAPLIAALKPWTMRAPP